MTLAQDLPQEILGIIFIRCLPDNALQLQPSSSLPPLVLCHVCSSWRKAAVGTPHLWTELSMQLPHTPGGKVLHTRFNALEFWGCHMGALLPSLHFQYVCLERLMSRQEIRKLVPFQTFFQSPVVLNAQSFTLDGFPNLNLLDSTSPGNISFNNLEYLAVRQLSGRKHFALPLQFPTCPRLRRLHIDYDAWSAERPSQIVTAFSWVNVTHLSAHLRLKRQDWYAILAQCANMTSCSVVLRFLQEILPNDRPTTFHHHPRMLGFGEKLPNF